MQSAGIETGYGFFAPNVSENSKLVFQLFFPDGSSKLVLPAVHNEANALHLIDLLDRIMQTESRPLREVMLGKLAEPLWTEYPEAMGIRAIFGRVIMPDVKGYKEGMRPTYETLLAYDYSRTGPPSPP